MEDSSFILLLAGPSGAGKSSVLVPVVEADPQVHFSISCTTRKRRAGEEDGREYHFMSVAEFERARDAGEFVEWAEVHGNLYGTREADLRASLDRNEIPLLEIDVQGGSQIMDRFGNLVVSVFIEPPSREILEQRLRGRESEDEASLRQRLKNAVAELERAGDYQYRIVNEALEEAQAQLREIIDRERARRAT